MILFDKKENYISKVCILWNRIPNKEVCFYKFPAYNKDDFREQVF